MKRKKLFLLSCVFFSACTTTIPDVKVHAVAGRLQGGMLWAYTGHDETGEIDMLDAIKFLEDGALCISSEDYQKQKTAIEKLCYKAGAACTFENKQKLAEAASRIAQISKKKK